MKEKIKRIAVFTSGGDAPGMNAAVRAVVRTSAHHDLHVYGIYRGYQGMIEGDIHRLEKRDVGNIIQRGGTVLKTARSMDFMTEEGRKKAYDNLKAFDIDACVAIGGNGTMTGAEVFHKEYNIPFIGLPGTIDNDLYGTDFTIGFDTAVNTAIEAVDKIRDTAASHNRLFFIEVMGRNSGYIALYTAIGSGAGSVLIPEVHNPIEDLIDQLRTSVYQGDGNHVDARTHLWYGCELHTAMMGMRLLLCEGDGGADSDAGCEHTGTNKNNERIASKQLRCTHAK